MQENLDECVLCRLCLDAAPEGAVRVLKLYDNESRPGLDSPAGEGVVEVPAKAMNENFSLIVMCLFLLGSLAFLAEQLTAYH